MLHPETQREEHSRGFMHAAMPVWVALPVLLLTLLVGAGGGYVAHEWLTPVSQCPESPEVCEEFGVFWEVWDLASNEFVEPEVVVTEHMMTGAVNGMLDTLGDQGHTRYMSPEITEQWDETMSASFEGIGAYIDVSDGQATIVRPIEGSPAEAAGILAGDIIVAVDGEETTDWTVNELVANVRGPRGSTVVLTVIHPGETEPVDIPVERDTVEVPSVSWAMLPNDVALVRLNSFAQRSAEEMERALREVQEQGAQALILDLRDNSGGWVNEAVSIAGQFVPRGTTVYRETDRHGQGTSSETSHEGVAQDIPMVVLVNVNTASSSEIVSGALQDAGRAEVIGTPTAGTGTVLRPFDLQNGGQLLLGTSQWLTPDGRLIRNQGISPDVEVVLPVGAQQISPFMTDNISAEEVEESEDIQLQTALERVENIASQ